MCIFACVCVCVCVCVPTHTHTCTEVMLLGPGYLRAEETRLCPQLLLDGVMDSSEVHFQSI